MAGAPISTTGGAGVTGVQGSEGYRFPLIALTVLFFMWGFLTCLNDILIPHLKAVFDLSYTQAMLIQFCFFGAYFAVSLPAGMLVKRIGYQRGIVGGLLLAGVGCMLFYPAAETHTYALFLAALFVLASGITLLQVSANPYVTALGSSQTASSRLTLTQAFNSLGTTVAPFFGGVLILSAAAAGAESMGADENADAVKMPYLMLASALILLALIFSQLKLPILEGNAEPGEAQGQAVSLWSQAHLMLGALGIFLYVGAEVAIGSFLVNFLGEAHIAGLEESRAANYVAYYWGGAMVGRFLGAAVMRYLHPGAILAFNACAAILLLVVAIVGQGSAAMWAMLLVGLFNSIMFPTIFSLALANLGRRASQASGLLCLAIVGGALVPLLQGTIADTAGLQNSFWIPVVCYLYIAYYGLRGSRVKGLKK